MRRLVSIAAVVLAVAVVTARSGMQAPGAAEEQEGEKKLIDLKSDLMGPVAPGDSVVFLVGNFAAQHNGAVINTLTVTRLGHKYGYLNYFVMTVVIPIICTIVAAILSQMGIC